MVVATVPEESLTLASYLPLPLPDSLDDVALLVEDKYEDDSDDDEDDKPDREVSADAEFDVEEERAVPFDEDLLEPSEDVFFRGVDGFFFASAAREGTL